jgi:uncharacterized repeat protein (TIGR03803 family)
MSLKAEPARVAKVLGVFPCHLDKLRLAHTRVSPYEGGPFGVGTVFKLDKAGANYTTLHSFGNPGQHAGCE